MVSHYLQVLYPSEEEKGSVDTIDLPPGSLRSNSEETVQTVRVDVQ